MFSWEHAYKGDHQRGHARQFLPHPQIPCSGVIRKTFADRTVTSAFQFCIRFVQFVLSKGALVICLVGLLSLLQTSRDESNEVVFCEVGFERGKGK